MIAFSELFPTKTGLDVLEPVDQSSLVAEMLWRKDSVPATKSEILDTYAYITGRAPSDDEYLTVEQFLLSFGWLR